MKPIVLTEDNYALECKLGEAISTAEVEIVGAYHTIDLSDTPRGFETTPITRYTSGTADITLVSAPAPDQRKEVVELSFYNADDIVHTVILKVQLNSPANEYRVFAESVAAGDTITLSNFDIPTGGLSFDDAEGDPANVAGAAADGTSEHAARRDHVHAITSAVVDTAGAVMESDYNANTILAATTDNTPVALTIAERRLVGRITGGNIDDLTPAEVRTLLDQKVIDIFYPTGYEPPAASYATLDTRNAHVVLDFDGAADEEAVWKSHLPTWYGGGGLTVDIYLSFTSATSGTSGWQVAIERIDLSGLDIDADSFVAFNGANVSVPGTSGMLVKATVTFTDGADMDSLAAGEPFRLKIRRDADGTTQTDDVTTDAEVHFVVLKET